MSANEDPAISSDNNFQASMLAGVSRTFALTIPQLPRALYPVVANAYLLCRIADTIEDDPGLDSKQSREFSERFIRVVAGEESALDFAHALLPHLSNSSIPEEHRLVDQTQRVITITHGFNDAQQAALHSCIRIMSRGMTSYQQNASVAGLVDMPDMDRYCYHVAGVVGECLTRLFCDYSPAMAVQHERLTRLGVSFGQGLQMTNILKDLWDDFERGACWLPADVFAEAGFDLADLAVLHGNRAVGCRHQPERNAFEAGLTTLLAIAREHLVNALEYTLMIPASERGMRNFCLWALGMALLTLRRINANLSYGSGTEVKISRTSVRATIAYSRMFAGSDVMLRFAFARLARPLPVLTQRQREQYMPLPKG